MEITYPCIEINLKKIAHNIDVISSYCKNKDINVAAVSKVFCAEIPIVQTIIDTGIKIIGDSRIENLEKIRDLKCKKMLLRIPMESQVEKVVKFSDISLNSELDTIKELSHSAKKLGLPHKIILMIDLGDLREGILEKDVLQNVSEILKLDNIELYGIGTNLTCYGGVIPDENNLGRLVALKNKIEQIFRIKLEVVSGGNSSSLQLVLNGKIPEGINQLRIGEGIVLGRETAFGNHIDDCYNDCFIIKGEIIELKDKPSVPIGRIGMDAFGEKPTFKDKGIMKRAILAIGKQDISIKGLIPMDGKINILGGSSDHLILDITHTDHKYEVGDIVDFRVDYGCLLAAMTSPYIAKYYIR